MKIVVFPSDATGCGYYRLRWAALELAKQGHDVEIREEIRWTAEGWEPRIVDVKGLDCDVAVFQRVFHRKPDVMAGHAVQGGSLDLLRAVQAKGVAVVVDLDDDLGAIDERHSMYPLVEGAGPIVQEACRTADLVTVSTPALAKRYGGGKARVIPNGVPRAYLGIEHQGWRPTAPVIGWTGTPKTHVGDLEVVGTTIRDLVHEDRATFRAIGDLQTLKILGVPNQEFIRGGPLATFEYARLYAQLDVAIVPLRESRFNAGKSWLKGAEAAALGVPVVMSPTPENVRLHGLGIGILAETRRDWREHLLRLLAAPGLRQEIAAQGRAIMAGWTIEGHIAPMCWEAWTGARALRGTRQVVLSK